MTLSLCFHYFLSYAPDCHFRRCCFATLIISMPLPPCRESASARRARALFSSRFRYAISLIFCRCHFHYCFAAAACHACRFTRCLRHYAPDPLLPPALPADEERLSATGVLAPYARHARRHRHSTPPPPAGSKKKGVRAAPQRRVARAEQHHTNDADATTQSEGKERCRTQKDAQRRSRKRDVPSTQLSSRTP